VNKGVSVVLVNYNSGRLLRDALESILGGEKKDNIEIIVIDNNSRDSSLEEARRLFPQVTYIINRKNFGFSKAVNQGLRTAKAEAVLLLNPDTAIGSKTLQEMADFLDKSPRTGIIGPKLLNPDGTRQLSCRSFPGIENAIFNRYSPLTRIFPGNKFSRKYLLSRSEDSQLKEVDWVSGACMMIKKFLLDEIGLFDENFFMYCEDIDICLRAKKAGWEVYYLPQTQAVHQIRNGKRRASLKSIIDHHLSMYKFYKKHYTKNRFMFNFFTSLGLVFSALLMIGYKKIMKAGA